MKFLKLFEEHRFTHKPDNQNQVIKFDNLEKGDFVIINCRDLGVDNEVMILMDEPTENADGFTIWASMYGDSSDEGQSFYDYEIVKKLNKAEAEFYTNVNKYNL